MLIENTLFGLKDKVKNAIQILKDLEPSDGYKLAFSGGKDSISTERLCQLAKVKYETHYSNPTIDPPELTKFMKKHYPNRIIHNPEKSLLNRMVEKGIPPTRIMRWCCAEYKENLNIPGRWLTGVRSAESYKRKNRRQVELCYNNPLKNYLHPIFEWSDAEVWEFIKAEKLPYCCHYDEGWKRVGCLMCPMADKHRRTESERYPYMTKVFIKHFQKLYDSNLAKGKDMSRWDNGEDMFNKWIAHNPTKIIPDQTVMFE